MKKLQGYRTILANLMMAGAILFGMEKVDPEVMAEHAGTILEAVALIWGGVNIILRWLTKGPIGEKVEE